MDEVVEQRCAGHHGPFKAQKDTVFLCQLGVLDEKLSEPLSDGSEPS